MIWVYNIEIMLNFILCFFDKAKCAVYGAALFAALLQSKIPYLALDAHKPERT